MYWSYVPVTLSVCGSREQSPPVPAAVGLSCALSPPSLSCWRQRLHHPSQEPTLIAYILSVISVCTALLLSSATPSPRSHGILSVCLLSVAYALGKMTMEASPVCGNESVSLFAPCTRSLYARATCTSAKQNTLPTRRMNFALRLSWAGSVPVKHGCILYGTQPTSSKSLSPLLIYHLKSALTGSPLDVYYRNSMWQYICYTRSPCFLRLMNNFCTRNLNLLPNLIIINSVALP